MICPKCGTLSNYGANFCHNCGYKLKANVPAATPEVQASDAPPEAEAASGEGGEGPTGVPDSSQPYQEQDEKERYGSQEDDDKRSPRRSYYSMKPSSAGSKGEAATGEERSADEEPQASQEADTREAWEKEMGGGGGGRDAGTAGSTRDRTRDAGAYEPDKAVGTDTFEDEGEERSKLLRNVGIVVLLLIMLFLIFTVGKSAISYLSTNKTTAASSTTVASTTTALPKSYNPTSSGGSTLAFDVEYNSDTVLQADIVTSGKVLIDPNVTLTTNGHSIIAGAAFVNQGTIVTGSTGNIAPSGSKGQSYPSSYGGSGGAGAGGGGPQSGSTPAAPSLSSSLVQGWYTGGMTSYLAGAGGGGGCPHGGYGASGGNTLAAGGILANQAGPGGGCTSSGGGLGGSGGYGIYIQATSINAGTINTNGQYGSRGAGDSGGGGGGGAILLAYRQGYVKGQYGVAGGSGASGGGSGLVMTFSYGGLQPVSTS